MRRLRTMTMPVLIATMLTFGFVTTAPMPVEAQQAGLVNVSVGDVNLLNNVNVGVALALAANVCGGAQVGVLAVQLQRIGHATCTATSGAHTGDTLQFTRVQQ